MDRFRAVLSSALPPEVSVAVRKIGAEAPLLAGEDAPMARMSPARRAEYSTGRAAAHEAMQALGLPPSAVPMGTDRAPVWPAGLTGALAHGGGYAACLMARADEIRALGLDIEPDQPLSPDLWEDVLAPAEHAWAETRPDPGRAALEIFVAKECAYKAQFALTGCLLDFSDLVIMRTEQGFSARFQRPVGRFRAGDLLAGRLLRASGLVFATCALSA